MRFSVLLASLIVSANAFAMSEIVTWLMGALTDRGWSDVWIAAPPALAGIALLMLAGRSLDALTLGEAAARSLGVRPGRLQALLILGVGLTVGPGVAAAGIIGFVGLIVPHLVRPLTDRRPSSLSVQAANPAIAGPRSDRSAAMRAAIPSSSKAGRLHSAVITGMHPCCTASSTAIGNPSLSDGSTK